MSGPPPKPTAMLKLSGSWRARGRKNEPTPVSRTPPSPPWLDDEGKKAWKQIVPILERMRVITEADGFALAVLCEAWSRYRRATDMLNQYGDVYPVKNPDGSLKMLRRSPYSAMQMELALNVRRMLAEFGLTPAARGRLIALPEVKTDGKASYFARPTKAG